MARQRKRYGPVQNRGVCRRVQEQATKARKSREAREASYTVPVGTACHVRRLGETTWRPHVTVKPVVACGYLWRNSTHYGLAWGEWEIKVSVDCLG